jgi:two-component system NtrC family sensor kinase
MFQSIRKAMWWFLAYLVLVTVALCLDRYFIRPIVPISHSEMMVGHGLNIILLSITMFMTMMYFVNAFQKEHARAEDLVVHLEEANRELAASLNEVKAMQAEKMASLGNLVAGIAHEINNPIGAVESASDVSRRCVGRIEEIVAHGETIEVIREDQHFQQALRLLEANHQTIVKGSKRIETIVRSLRNFARLDEAGFQKADLHEGLDSTLTLLEHELRDGISVDKAYGEIPPIYCYPNELNQVFMNLLVNAIQAIDGEGTIMIRTLVESGSIHIQIADTGAGIPVDQQAGLFEPRFAKQGSRVKAGLGLFTCYNILQKHHGDITVESEVGQGTTVTITIPTGLASVTDST